MGTRTAIKDFNLKLPGTAPSVNDFLKVFEGLEELSLSLFPVLCSLSPVSFKGNP